MGRFSAEKAASVIRTLWGHGGGGQGVQMGSDTSDVASRLLRLCNRAGLVHERVETQSLP